MIINKLVFPIKSDLSFVEGGIPQGMLTANSINRDILYVISPAVKETVITAFFQNQKQTEDTQQATFFLSDLSIDYLVSKDTSYYELVKDWNVWQTQIPSKALEFISYNRAGKIGISFAFKQLLEPSGYEGSQEITNDNFVINDSGSYIIKIPYYHFLGNDFTYNDVLIYNGGSEVSKKPAIALQGTTGTLEYSVDPSVYMGGYEEVDIGLTESILSKLGENSGEIKLLKLKFNNYYTIEEVDNKDIAASNILNANPNIVFENEVIYNRRVRGWEAVGEIPIYLRKDEIGTNRIQGSAIVGDEIFWIGGTTVTATTSVMLNGASNKNISYNLKTNVWKENLDLPYRKDAPTLVAVGTDIYVLGSMGRKNKFRPFDNVFVPDYKYDTLTDTYEEISSLQDNDYLYVSHQSSGADHLEGKLYISGRLWVRKEKTTGDIDSITEPRIAIYDIENDTWSLGATPPMSNNGGSSKILDRKFYVYRNTLYAYDIDNDTWSSPLNVSGIESRSHTSMAKRDGKLYVIGGFITGSSPVRTSGKTYVYDPILNEWEEDVDLLLNNAYGIGIGYLMAVVWNDRLVVFGGTGFDENKYSSGSKIEDQFRNFNVYIEDYRLEKDLTPIYEKSKDYTYSQVEIDNKDTAIMNKANNLENANMFKDVVYNNVNGVLTFTKYDDTTKEIDLPLELIVTSGYYDEVANELVLVLANGSEIRIPVDNLLTDLDAHNIRFNGSGTNYLVNKNDVESAVKELDTRVKTNTSQLDTKEDFVVKTPYFYKALQQYIDAGEDYATFLVAWNHSLTVEIVEENVNIYYNYISHSNYDHQAYGIIIPEGVLNVYRSFGGPFGSYNKPIVFPEGLQIIEEFTFVSLFSNTKEVVLPSSLQAILDSNFSEFNSDYPVIIPRNIIQISAESFYNAIIPYVIMLPQEPPSISSNTFGGNSTFDIYVSDIHYDDYYYATNWVNLRDRLKKLSELELGG